MRLFAEGAGELKQGNRTDTAPETEAGSDDGADTDTGRADVAVQDSGCGCRHVSTASSPTLSPLLVILEILSGV